MPWPEKQASTQGHQAPAIPENDAAPRAFSAGNFTHASLPARETRLMILDPGQAGLCRAKIGAFNHAEAAAGALLALTATSEAAAERV